VLETPAIPPVIALSECSMLSETFAPVASGLPYAVTQAHFVDVLCVYTKLCVFPSVEAGLARGERRENGSTGDQRAGKTLVHRHLLSHPRCVAAG
jgi:hypothetical protein